MLNNRIKIVAVSGSLRANSSNAVIIEAIEKMVPDYVEFFIYKGLAGLPHFDGAEDIPIAVSVWKKHLNDADAVLICSPEYAFGVPGSLKNALDWTVASGDLANKPLALITASTGGQKAHAALLDIFTALGAQVPHGSALLIPYVRAKINAAGEITDPVTGELLKQLLRSLLRSVAEKSQITQPPI